MNAKEIALKGFPEYKGKKFSYQISDGPFKCRSEWGGGSCTFYSLVNIYAKSDLFTNDKGTYLTPGIALVTHAIFCGKDMGLTVYFHPDDVSYVPEKEEVNEHEMTVLIATRAWKNSYNGRSDIRFKEAREATGISKEDWLKAQQSLKEKKLLNARYALTNKGRHTVGRRDMREHAENIKVRAIPLKEIPLYINQRWQWESSEKILMDRLNNESI